MSPTRFHAPYAPYAETHFTFGLPWSPLFRKWPEIFLDAPHQLLPGKPLNVWLMVKDAHRFPVRIRAVRFKLWDETGATASAVFEPDTACKAHLQHLAFPLPVDGFRGRLRVEGTIEVENKRGRRRAFVTHNYPGLEPFPLEIDLLAHPLPYPSGWRAGELHCHSEFTSDQVEFGAPLTLMQQTADAVGLDFVLCTDHSYDFPYHRDRYFEPVDPHANFAAFRAQVAALNEAHPDRPTLVAGEEISCGNARGQNIHLLAFGHPAFIPGNGDGGRRGFNNRPDLTLGAVLEQLGDTPSFAAHPAGHQAKLEQWILGRGPWRQEDVRTQSHGSGPANPARGVRGLQFWNGSLDREYHNGKALWINELLRGNRLLPLGANDAHGDFNHNIWIKTPLLSLRHGRDHLFGRVRTLVPTDKGRRDEAALRAAFQGDICTCTDGPFATLTRDTDGRLNVTAESTEDFGAFSGVTVWGARRGETRERALASWTFDGTGPHAFAEPLDVDGDGYARLEVVTRHGRRALTAAVAVG